MKTVKIKFENEAYNYITSVNPKATKKDVEDYFVGTCFDMGAYPVEDFQKCIDVEELTGIN